MPTRTLTRRAERGGARKPATRSIAPAVAAQPQPDPKQVRTRRMTVIAQDPDVRGPNGKILTAEIEIPAEQLARGPRGYRVHVIDYDASTKTFYTPIQFDKGADGLPKEVALDLANPAFHAQNVYALVMKTLGRFEFALGRHVRWAFDGHQIKIVPHAFADANAFYSRRDEAILFGYFPGRKGKMVFSCLSHDVVVHETTHALIDGLRSRFMDPSSPDQAAFHEGLSDVVALLSIYSMREVVESILVQKGRAMLTKGKRPLVDRSAVDRKALVESVLLGLADQMGSELSNVRGQALRNSANLKRSPEYYQDSAEFREPHRRGEILVAAMMNAFLDVWLARLSSLGTTHGKYLDLRRVSEEAADAADYLLTMAIRALDYCPPIHLTFSDYLSAMLTADLEIRPDDSRFGYRHILRQAFADYGIGISEEADKKTGAWKRQTEEFATERVHFEQLQRDPDEVFRFVWENRHHLDFDERAYTRVESVRPCVRVNPDDGFTLHETVVECVQWLNVKAGELGEKLGIRKPADMSDDLELLLQGGVTLIFDNFGQLKYSIANLVGDRDEQSQRLEDLWNFGFFQDAMDRSRRFSALHRRRSAGSVRRETEVW